MIMMDDPEHSRLRKIVSRGFTPRAVERLRADLSERAQRIATEAAARVGRLCPSGGLRVAAAGHRRPARGAAGGLRQAVRLDQQHDRQRRPGVRRERRPHFGGRIDVVRHAIGGPQGRRTG